MPGEPARALLRWLDAFQRRHRVLAVCYAVQRKLGDDNGGTLVAQLTYSGFVTVFPLLLLFVTVLGLVFSSDPSLRHSLLHSSLRDFPVVGSELGHNVRSLKSSSAIGLAVSLVVLVYGCAGLGQAGLYALHELWDIPQADRPGTLEAMARSVGFLGVLAVGVVVSTFLAGVGTYGSRQPLLIEVGAVALSLLVNCGQYLAGLRILTGRAISTRSLLLGAVAGGCGWTVLLAVGTYLVGHDLRGDSTTYGTFAAVLGLLAWIYLAARLTLYAVELNVVVERGLSPRSLVRPPLTKADKASLAAQAESARSLPEERVAVSFEEGAGT